MNAHLFDSDWDYYDATESKSEDDDREPDEPEEDLNAECVWDI